MMKFDVFSQRIVLTALLAMFFFSGCTVRSVHKLSSEDFSPTPKGEEIKLFVNDIRRPHVKIAQVQSFSAQEPDKETKRRQLQDLIDLAREQGADAVVDVRQLSHRIRGMVLNERTPFPSYRQGRSERYFLRGTAIKYTEDGAGFAEAPGDVEPAVEELRPREGLQEATRSGGEDESLLPFLPRGLGPLFR